MATNYIQPGDVIKLTWATTSPTAGDPCVKATSKAAGAIIGVALNGIASASETVEVALSGVWDLPITSTAAMAVGDYVYGSVAGNVEVCTTTLSDTNTGIAFGRLLEAITAASTVTREVLLVQPAHL